MLIIVSSLLVFTVILLVIGAIFSGKVIDIKVFSNEKIVQLESSTGNCDRDTFNRIEAMDKEELEIPSKFGYTIKGWLIRPENPSSKVMIFSHGITMSRYGSIKYMDMFLKRGWNCILYDHRRHGDTQGKYTTFGFYEKNDLKSIVDWVREAFGSGTLVGIHGESMGSSIALLYAGMEDGADFYIADCPYSSLEEQLAYRLKVEYNLPRWPVMPVVNLFIKHRAGFTMKQVSPLEYISNIHNPVLFIHSINDRYIPVQMTQSLYEKKDGFKRIYLAEKGGHATALQANREEYEQVVEDFLEEILSDHNRF